MDFDTLSREIHELQQMRDELVASLTESIDRLRTLGSCPLHDMLEHAGRYRLRYALVYRQLSQSKCGAGTTSLDGWEQAIRLTQRRQQVLELLEEAAVWQIRGSDTPGPLAKLQGEVATLRQQFQDEHNTSTVEQWDDRHPLAAAFSLIHRGDELTDAEWAEMLDLVVSHYGRDLATAISRGKVIVPETRSACPGETTAVEQSRAVEQKIEVLA